MGTVSLDARALKATRRRWQLGTVLCTLFLGLLAIIVLYPLILVVVDSFEVATPGQPVAYGIANWVAALTEPGLSSALEHAPRPGRGPGHLATRGDPHRLGDRADGYAGRRPRSSFCSGSRSSCPRW